MAKKLILLIMIIPIIVMVCLFAVTKTVSNLIDVTVSGLDIIGDNNQIYLDMDKGETYTLEYAVYPTNAKNKEITITTEAIDGEHLAKFDFVKGENEITIIPKAIGSAKIFLTTIDGGFKESVVVHVDSTALQSIESTASSTNLTVGEHATISTVFYPASPSNTILDYVSSNENVVQVNSAGVITAVGKGVATVTVISEYNPDITDTVTIEVKNADAMDLGRSEIVSWSSGGKIPISIDTDSSFDESNLSYVMLYEDGTAVPASVVTASFVFTGGAVSLDYTFLDDGFVGNVTAKITFSHGDSVITKECRISRVREISVEFDSDNAHGINADQTSYIPFTVTPSDADVTYAVSASNDNVTVRMTNGGRLVVVGNKAGISRVTLTVTSVDFPDMVKTIECDVVVKPKKMTVTETGSTYGIENVLTVGQYQYDYSDAPTGTLIKTALTQNAFALHFYTPTELGWGFADNFTWHSDTPEVLIDKNGIISFADDTFSGMVNFYATFSYDGVEVSTGSFSVRCVADGVNVYSYPDLLYATRSSLPVVLHKDIKEDFGYINGQVQYTEIETTYDKTYYENIGKSDETKVKVLIEFKNDVYGNGHVINADKVTYALYEDADGNKTQDKNALFQGPLNFVMMIEKPATATSDAVTLSVKGQDNICFAVYENVTVNNVELRGCDLRSDGDKYDLVDLTYIGTTVEIIGDNVDIKYSRLTNGRTVLRAFGDIFDSEKEISLNIQNSVLSGAREFIMRIGSNRFKYDKGVPSPSLDGDTGEQYNTKEIYNTLTDAQKAAYDEKFINTYVTVKNSIFKDAGLFAIGMDSHFAGGALADGSTIGSISQELASLLVGWKDLAKTSYGAKVTFEGEVELYSWKDIEDVDSSTLLEIKGDSKYERMKFDVKAMIQKLSSTQSFKNITTTYDDKQYVHSGIAFFGGGKNYSVFESKTNIYLNHYKVSLGDVGKIELGAAAGDEPFYFFLYDATSLFTPQIQAEKLASGEAYECIYK